MEFTQYRPGDTRLNDDDKYISLIDELYKSIIGTSHLFSSEEFRLSNEKFHRISHLLIEFFEDIHFDIGIWRSYEKFNEATFGTKLPGTLSPNVKDVTKDQFNALRIQHFLWNIYQTVEPDYVWSPFHHDFVILSKALSLFMSGTEKRFPGQSSVKMFLNLSNEDGYDVKKKLIWLGTKSYFFRENFNLYLAKGNFKKEIPVIDDFIVQITTTWSGMGVIDILAGLLNIPQSRKDEIKSWYERHASFYLIKSSQGKKVIAENIINQQNYRIIVGSNVNPFKINDLIFGNIVKYGTEWYWSGKQHSFNSLTKEQIQETKEDFILNSSIIVYRYDKALLKKAQDRNIELYKEFVEYFGSDFIVFSNGIDLATSLQKQASLRYEKLTEGEFEKLKDDYGLINKSPKFNYPENVVNSENEIALFYNINEGQEILTEYTSLKSSLKKEGKDLTSDDLDFIYAMIEDPSISPAFVQRILSMFGTKSVLKAYLLKEENDIDYIIHKHKGIFFKNRYPTLTIVNK